ncbi:MAG: CpsB/CapC family capsule biosynthesis tyrosine phosphatase [Clostridia bacterium]
MECLVDIHQHLLYGMDDGPEKWELTLRMLQTAQEQNVWKIVATPHARPGRYHFDYSGMVNKLNAINEYAWRQGWQVRIFPGAEIYYTPDTVRCLDERRVATLAQSQAVLVEFSPSIGYDQLYQAIRDLANGGYKPVLAHIERYECLVSRPERTYELKNQFEAKLQMNCQTLLRQSGFSLNRFCHKLLINDTIDFVASDAHNITSRPSCLQECYKYLGKKYGEELAYRLTGGNQRAFLECLR